MDCGVSDWRISFESNLNNKWKWSEAKRYRVSHKSKAHMVDVVECICSKQTAIDLSSLITRTDNISHLSFEAKQNNLKPVNANSITFRERKTPYKYKFDCIPLKRSFTCRHRRKNYTRPHIHLYILQNNAHWFLCVAISFAAERFALFLSNFSLQFMLLWFALTKATFTLFLLLLTGYDWFSMIMTEWLKRTFDFANRLMNMRLDVLHVINTFYHHYVRFLPSVRSFQTLLLVLFSLPGLLDGMIICQRDCQFARNTLRRNGVAKVLRVLMLSSNTFQLKTYQSSRITARDK